MNETASIGGKMDSDINTGKGYSYQIPNPKIYSGHEE